MATTRYLSLRYTQLRSKLLASSCGDVPFTNADDLELARIYSELYRRGAIARDPGYDRSASQAA